jgi:hypothetical protein
MKIQVWNQWEWCSKGLQIPSSLKTKRTLRGGGGVGGMGVESAFPELYLLINHSFAAIQTAFV